MILDRLVLHNFGVYAGRQTFELTPPSSEQPVILIGGLNGGGKTTLLEALQLVLFGRRSAPAVVYDGKYDDFLLSCISKSASPWEGAGLELTFRVRREGHEQSHVVHRSWRRTASGVRETLEVLRDGAKDDLFTDQWAERVEEILPAEVAPLFFFDGERIEQLADLEKSASVLGTTVQAILGLDIVDRLMGDLTVLERRHQKRGRTKKERDQLTELEQAFARLQREYANVTLTLGQLRNALDAAEKAVVLAQREFEKAGGVLYSERLAVEAKRSEVLAAIRDVDNSLRTQAAGSTPLLLVRPLLQRVQKRAEEESVHDAARNLEGVLEARDMAVIKALEASNASTHFLRQLGELFELDRSSRTPASLSGPRLGLSHDAHQRLDHLLADGLDQLRSELQALVERRGELQEDLDAIERTLADVPDEESLAAVTKALQLAQQDRDTARIRVEAAILEQQRTARETEHARSRLARELERQGLDRLSQEDSARLVLHAARTRAAMEAFRTRVVQRHVRRIEDLVLDSFRQLLRKTSLVERLEINPDGYAVTIRDRNGDAVPSESLSAGERQLLAVSLLWGMARAASRPLPFVVDTPLGRLDSYHRVNLVERYFPMASHQTIVLSTDEEIDDRYYPRLKRYVGREYLLNFDDSTRTTTVCKGYFFQ